MWDRWYWLHFVLLTIDVLQKFFSFIVLFNLFSGGSLSEQYGVIKYKSMLGVWLICLCWNVSLLSMCHVIIGRSHTYGPRHWAWSISTLYGLCLPFVGIVRVWWVTDFFLALVGIPLEVDQARFKGRKSPSFRKKSCTVNKGFLYSKY